MSLRNICAISVAVSLIMGFAGAVYADTTYTTEFFTCVGGASGMTLSLKPPSVQRGCASKMMDITLKQKNYVPGTGTVYSVYNSARMKASDPEWSEPTDGWVPGQQQFTGDKCECELNYIICDTANQNEKKILWALVLRGDSVLGLRWVVNRQFIYAFSNTWKKADGTTAAEGPDLPMWNTVKAAVEAMAASPTGIPIEGGLSECYMDSGVRAIDRHNRLYVPPGGRLQPQLNPANFATTKDNILAIAVMAIIYNVGIEELTGPGVPLNITNQMERMISAGMVDNWDVFFSTGHKPMFNYYREALSGTNITYLNLIMRGLEYGPNGTVDNTLPVCSDGTQYHRSGIPQFDCVYGSNSCPNFKPGGGEINKAVNATDGAHSYTFLQKFTNATPPHPDLSNIRVAKFNGYEPYDFTYGNSLPGYNGVPDVNADTSTTYYRNVIDGKYPLWTYNHCFDATNGTSQNLADYVANFRLAANAQKVREVGLVALSDMETYASHRTINPSGPNAGRGKGLGRCGFVSPITGEVVRDGMMFMLNDSSTPDGLPSEGYVEMRP